MRKERLGNGSPGIMLRILLTIALVWPLVTAPVVTEAALPPPFGTGKATTRAVTVTRVLPTNVTAGQTFQVSVAVTTPAGGISSLGLTDFAPTGWTTSGARTLSNPVADAVVITGNKMEILWYSDIYAENTIITGVYQVTVSPSATPATYNFTGGFIEYYNAIGGGPFTSNVTGAPSVTILAQTPPTVTTDNATSIANTSATLNGTLNSLGTSSNATLSFQYGLTDNYTSASETATTTTNATGAFSAAVTSLSPFTTYHFRAKAVGSSGTSYGSDRTFTTTGTAPAATSDAASNIGVTSANVTGTVSSLGTASTVQVSFEWGLDTNYSLRRGTTTPVTANATGTFSAALSGLSPSTLYHYRIKVVGHGTTYGADRTFTTAAGTPPTVTTDNATNITNTSALLGGTLSSVGSSTNATVSFQYGLSENYTGETTPATLSTPGTFTFNLTGLLPYTTYHYRARGTGHGTGNGIDRTFTTTGTAPTVTTDNATNVGLTTATLNGTVNSLGTAASLQASFEFGLTTQYSRGSTTPVTVNATGAFSANLTGLTPNTTYHFRIKAVGHGTAYGQDGTFLTLSAPPTVTTDNATDVRTTSAILNGTVTGLGSATSIQRSFEWGLTTAYTGGTTTPVTLSATGPYSFALTGLSPNTTYNYRAKAVGDGTAYGANQTFTTPRLDIIRDLPVSALRGETIDVIVTFTAPANLFNAIGLSDFVPVSWNITANKAWNTPAADQSQITTNATAGINRLDYIWYGPDNPDSTVGYPQGTAFTAVYRVGIPLGATPGVYTFNGQLEYYTGTAGPFTAIIAGDGTLNVLAISPPTVTTDAASNITNTSARLNATMSSLGSATSNITVSFQWGLTTNYTAETTAVTMNATGPFNANLTNLSPYTTYHYRARAIGDLTGYGADMTFMTTGTAPTATTEAATSIGTNSATLNGIVTGLGTATSLIVLFEWGLTTNYTSSTPQVTVNATGAQSFVLTGLAPKTTYHYAIHVIGHGMVLGADRTFTTLPLPPTVTTENATAVTATTATLNGILASLGTATSVQVSFEWSGPVIVPALESRAATTPVTVNATGPFSVNLTGLSPSSIYQFNAVAVGDGTATGTARTFTTLTLPPAVTTNEATAITQDGATFNARLNGLGSAPTVQVSFEWGTDNASLANTTTAQTLSSPADFTFVLTGQPPVTTIYFRAKAVGHGTVNGAIKSFRTATVAPTVTTGAASDISGRSAMLNGVLSNKGSAQNIEVFFEWGPTTGYGNSTPRVTTNATGAFIAMLTGLQPTTTYYFRAVAVGDGGSYGAQASFTTLTLLLTITVTPPTDTVPLGRTRPFSAMGGYSDNTTSNITAQATWTSDNTTVATISSTGLATSRAMGTTTIRATRDGVTGTAVLTVGPKVLDTITVAPPNPSLAKGRSLQFGAMGTYSDNSTEDMTTTSNWTSTGPTIASIGATTGLARALAVGTSTISAARSGVTGSTLLTVNPAELDALAISPANQTVPKGRPVQYTAMGTYSDNSTSNITGSVTWASDNLTVATISGGGLAQTRAEGTTIIRANQGTVSSNTTLTVGPKVLDVIGVTPATVRVPKGLTQQFSATGTYSDNSTENITASSSWSSSAPTVASIGETTGLATTLLTGATLIRATKSGITSDPANLTVETEILQMVLVSPNPSTIFLGQSSQFTARGTYSDNNTVDITSVADWASSNTTVASIGLHSGLAQSLAVGSTNITARLGIRSGSASLTVGAAAPSSLEITPDNPLIARGNSLQFSAVVQKTDGSTEDRTASSNWTSSNPAVATIDAAGLGRSVGTGTTVITANYSAGGVTDTTTLTVGPPTLAGVRIRESPTLISMGRTVQLHLDGTYSDNNTTDLTNTSTWASLNRAIATVSATGLVTGVAVGSTNITAGNGGYSARLAVTVTAAELDAITLTPLNPTLPRGDTVQFTATGTYSDNSSRALTSGVTWGTSDNTVAGISAAGLATALNAGTSNITASSGGRTGSTRLTVTAATLRSIAIATDNLTVPAGLTRQFTATGTYSDNSTSNITSQVTWSSSSMTIASISNAAGSQGLATAIQQGTATIIASMTTATTSFASNAAVLNVTAAELVSLSLTPANPSIPAGRTQQFTATGSYTNGTTSPVTTGVTWASDNNTVASISNAGLATGRVIGTSNITTAVGTIVGRTLLTVTAPVLVSLAISPSSATFDAGRTQQFTATGTYSDNSTRNLSSAVDWTSSNNAVVALDNAGLATSYSAGSATITATLGDSVASATLTVRAAVLDSITISPLEQTIARGRAQQFRAMALYSDSSRPDITNSSTWTSTNTAIASVGSTGLATSAPTGALGTTNITVTKDTRSATTTLRVTDASLESIAVTTDNLTVPAGRTRQFTAIGTYSDNSTSNITSQVAWASTSPTIARINATGLANSFTPGTTMIMATLSGLISLPVTLTVGAGELDSLAITPENPDVTLVSGAPPTVQFTSTARYSDGRTPIVTSLSAWTSSNAAVATTNATSGLATTVGAGTTNIGAAYLGKTATTVLRVRPDTVAPVVTMTSPSEGVEISDKNLSVAGNVNDLAAAVTVILNGSPLPPLTLDGSGNFSQGVLLNAGNNSVMVRAQDGSGNVGASPTVNVVVNPNKPNVTITRPADGYTTNARSLTIRGTVSDNVTSVILRLNGVASNVTATGGNFSTTVTLSEGDNMYVANAYAPLHDGDTDYLGTSGTKTATLDTTPPVIVLTSPATGSVVSTSGARAGGTVDDPGAALVLVILNGGIPQVVPVSGGVFNQDITLVPGPNTLVAVTTDRVGNPATSNTVELTLDNTRPQVTVTAPLNGLVTNAASQRVTGTVGEPAITSGTVYVNGVGQTFAIAPDGTFSQTVALASGNNIIRVDAQDNAAPPNVGSSGNITLTVDTVAPDLTLGLSPPNDSISILVTSDEALSSVPAVVVEPTSRQTPVTMTRVDVNRWVGTYGSATSPIAAGPYLITITGIDRAGNRAVKTATFTKTTISVDGQTATSVQTSSTTVNVETNGAVDNATMSVTSHMENPSGLVNNPSGAPQGAGAFVEINASPGLRNNLRQAYIRVNYNRSELAPGTDEYSLRLYVWDTNLGIWGLVPDSGVNVPETYIFGTTRTFSKFGGFGGTTTAAPPPPGGGGGGGVPTVNMPLTGFTTSNLRIDENGVALAAARLQTPDNKVTLSIPMGTRLVGANGRPLTSLSVSPVSAPSAPPAQQAVLAAYNFGPDGARFTPSLDMALTYERATLASGAKESDLYIAFWDGTQWQPMASTVDTATATVSTKADHFTQFAVLSKLPAPTPTPTVTPPAVPKPKPTPTPTVTPPAVPKPKPTLTPTVVPAVPKPTPTPTPTPPAPPPPPPGANWLVIVIIIAVVVAGIVGWLVVSRRKTKQDQA